MQRGERQNERTKEAVVGAFMQLVKEQGYESITIQEISDRANVGRSTFYRHFMSKADVLLAFHEGIFARLASVYGSAEEWLAEEPPPQVIYFLQRMQPPAAASIFSLYRFGPDLDYLLGNMDKRLTSAFAQSLAQAFADRKSTIPLSLLAASIAGIYGAVIRSWLADPATMTAAEVAQYLQRLVRATLCEALGKSLGRG
ncbi:MAG: TetR/AcrR family transcriptional regulator [Caldilinea sp. CFX5]|nr:TetR/AcrR family transcriptional regulator [Caldilinea sp. CFX5]